MADLLSAAAGAPPESPTWYPSPYLRVLFIGDSLDKHLMQGFCRLDKNRTKIKWLVHKQSGTGICRGAALTVANYRIFGLARPSQQYLLPKYEKRQPISQTWDTYYRLSTMLKRDMPDATSFDAIVLHSGVWDLSRPTTTTDPVRLATVREYHAAVRNISQLMRRQFPRSKIFWRSGPPVGHRDSAPKGKAFVTRTVKSQHVLHSALKDAVNRERRAGNVDGDVLDWFGMLTGYTYLAAADRNKIHYPEIVDLAFLNLFLNALRVRMATVPRRQTQRLAHARTERIGH